MTKRRREVIPQSNGTVEIREPDGTVIFSRDELSYQRALRALRGPGKPYVHIRPKKPQ